MSKKLYPIKPDNELDVFHYHEALERVYLLEKMVQEFLIEHVVYQKHPELLNKIKSISSELAAHYQIIGNLKGMKDIETQNISNQGVKNT